MVTIPHLRNLIQPRKEPTLLWSEPLPKVGFNIREKQHDYLQTTQNKSWRGVVVVVVVEEEKEEKRNVSSHSWLLQ